MQKDHQTSSDQIDTGLASLILVANFHGLPASSDSLKHRFAPDGKPLTELGLLKAAKLIGLKAKRIRTRWKQLLATPLPALALCKEGHYGILLRVDDEKQRVLVQHPLKNSPQAISKEEFESNWSGQLILLVRRAKLSDSIRKFDVSWFIPALLKYKKLFADVLLASFFLQLFALVSPLFFQVIIDKVLVHQGLTTLDVLAFGLLVIAVFEVLLGGLRTWLFSHTTNRVDVVLGARLFGHMVALPLSWFESRRVGNTVARVRELDSIREFLTGSALTLVIDLLFTVVFFAVMYYYSPILTWIVIGTLPFFILLSVLITPVLRVRLNEKFKRGAENQAFLVEAIGNVETIKAMAVEPQMQKRWEEQLSAYVKAAFKTSNLGNIANQCASFIEKVMRILLLWVGARLVIQGDLSVGQLIAFNMLSAHVSGPILRVTQLWQDFQQAGISIQRLGDILNSPKEPGYSSTRATLSQVKGRIRFENVNFRYKPDDPEILSNINLDIAAGQVIGIVGRSGSGKSTLTKLVQRLYIPSNGRIWVDNIDISTACTAWLRMQTGVVLQENRLLSKSIRDNIALAKPAAVMGEIENAAILAGADEFIRELAEGYDTLVEEHGANLSGGQRQRVAIARALLTQPRILIFDEATSALDYESERIIQDNMQDICKARTVLIIAHRLSTVRHADRIIVMEKGQILEDGNHNDLIDLKGYYAKLYQYQSGEKSKSVVDFK